MHIMITQPCAFVGDMSEHTKRYVAERNAKILLCAEYPTNTGYITPGKLLGDPNTAFSHNIADLLVTAGILSREPILGEDGKQLHITLLKKKSPLWSYSWALEDFAVLDEEKLLEVGWDLRQTPGFFNLVVVEAPEEEEETEPEEEEEKDDKENE